MLPLPSNLLLWAVLALAGLQVTSFVALALLTGFPLPVYDLMDFLLTYNQKGLSADWLLLLDNGHATVLPRLLLAADLWLTGGHTLTLILAALLARLLALALLLRVVWRSTEIAKAWRSLAIAVLALVFCRAFTIEPIVIPNGYNYDLMLLAAVVAMTAAAAIPAGRHEGLALPWLAGFAALCASFCLANGVLLFAILPPLAWLRQRRLAVLAPFMICGGIVLAIYMAGSIAAKVPIHVDALAVLDTLLHIAGAPWIAINMPIGYAIGMVLLFTSLAGIGWCLLRLVELDALAQLALILLLFSLGSMLVVAIGRTHLGPDAGLAGRYGLFVALLCAGLTLLGLRLLAFVPAWMLRAAPIFALAGALLLIMHQKLQVQVYWRLHAEAAADAALIRQGQRDPALFRHILPNPDMARETLNLLVKQRLYGLGAE